MHLKHWACRVFYTFPAVLLSQKLFTSRVSYILRTQTDPDPSVQKMDPNPSMQKTNPDPSIQKNLIIQQFFHFFPSFPTVHIPKEIKNLFNQKGDKTDLVTESGRLFKQNIYF